MTEQTDVSQQRRGIAAGVACYVLWGLFPLYWKLLESVNPLEVIAHRIIWCFASTAIACAIARLDLPKLLRQPRAWMFLAPAALIITLNWSVYIYAVDIGHVIETAIGYYINPLVSILLGVVVFRERLTRLQVTAIALCAFGVVFFTANYGQFPWIALLLAFSFGIYGAIKKKAAYPATTALAFESTVMLAPAILLAIALTNVTGSHAFGSNAPLTALLVLAGPATAIPLILFAKAANAIPLSLLGFIQYISPTISLLTGVFLFGESFTVAHAVCLGCIWSGLTLVTFETARRQAAASR